MLKSILFIAIAALIAPVGLPAAAQEPVITRTPLQTVDFPAGYTTVTTIIQVRTGCAGSHTHPGAESTYVMEGELVLKVDGEPDRIVKTGESFQVAPGVVHDACNTNATPAKALGVFVVEKGKALATPNPFLKAR